MIASNRSSVVSPAGTFSYQFSGPGSLVTKLTQPSGFWITNTFDSRARLTDTTLYDNTSTILNRHGYTLNHAHQRTMISRTNYASTSWNTYVDYTYDNAGEIRTAKTWRTGTNLLAWNFDYGYDAGWNILKRTNNAAVTSYSVNSLNQITADGGASWTHDSNGNLTYRPDSNNLTYTYDDENQLASVAAGKFYKLEFTYDGRGRLRVVKSYSWSGSSWTLSSEKRFLYDGMVRVQERSSSNHPTVTYTRGTDLSGSLDGAGGIGGLLSRGAHSGSSPYQLSSSAHYHADGNGNVTMLVGSGSPSIKGYYLYDPFGRTLSSGGTLATANVMRFSSKPVVGDYSTLYYYGYRFYDPTIQRWPNRDPLGDRAFKKRFNIPASRKRIDRNVYHFVFNGPVDSIDPFGLDNTPWPFNGGVCNCPDNAVTVCVLIDGDYYTLPPGQCTAAGNMNGGGSDVDGYWVDTTFYSIKTGFADACKPKDKCKWNWDPEGKNSPGSRGAKIGDTYPDGCGPVYVPPPLPPGPIRTGL